MRLDHDTASIIRAVRSRRRRRVLGLHVLRWAVVLGALYLAFTAGR